MSRCGTSRSRVRPIEQITRLDIQRILDATAKRGKEPMAHLLLAYVRRLFNWSIDRGLIDHSLCDRMRASSVIGKKVFRTRILTDHELAALWHASQRIGYPYDPFVQLLTLTGQRRTEVAEAEWGEFDLESKLWTIPPERMKMAAPHVVPLTDDAITIIRTLPRFGRYLFTLDGKRAFTISSRVKHRLDQEMNAARHSEALQS